MILWHNDHDNNRHVFRLGTDTVRVSYTMYACNESVRDLCDRLFRVMETSAELHHYNCSSNRPNTLLWNSLYDTMYALAWDSRVLGTRVNQLMVGSVLA